MTGLLLRSLFKYNTFKYVPTLTLTLAFSTSFLTQNAYAVSTDVRGFIALDLLTLEKREGDKQTAELGIGFFDVKLYADYEDFHMRVKLDLGNRIEEDTRRESSIGLSQNFLEEALISWRPRYDTQIMFGKGRVPFHQRRYGVINSSYISGGSILNTRHNFRDQKRKILVTYRHGAFSKRFFNHLTFFGDSRQVRRDRYDNPDHRDDQTLPYRQRDTFNTKEEYGFANRFEYLPFRGMNIAVAGLWHKRDLDPEPTYAFDASMRYSSRQFQVYAEYVWARVTTHPNDNFAVKKQYEQIAQLGGEYRFNRQWSALANMEYAWVNGQRWDRNNLPAFNDVCQGSDDRSLYCHGQLSRNNGTKQLNETAKLELGIKRRWGRSLQITKGAMVETQSWSVDSEKRSDRTAYQVAASLAFWY